MTVNQDKLVPIFELILQVISLLKEVFSFQTPPSVALYPYLK